MNIQVNVLFDPCFCEDNLIESFEPVDYQELELKKDRRYLSEICLLNLKLNNNLGHFDQKTTHYGALTERTDLTEPSSVQQKIPSTLKDQIEDKTSKSVEQLRTEGLETKQTKQKGTSNIQRLKQMIGVMQKLGVNAWSKLLVHMSKLSTADKYIRLVYSILKLYRVLNQHNNLSNLSKELLLARRIIQWEGKYSIIKSFKTQDLSAFEVAYKTLQLTANLFDFSSFWLNALYSKSEPVQKLAQCIYQWQDDCYFFTCTIELILSTKNLFQLSKSYLNQSYCEQKSLSFNHELTVLTQNKQKLVAKFNRLKQMRETENNIQQNVESLLLQTIQQRIQQKEIEISQLMTSYEGQHKDSEKKIKLEMIKNFTKMLKYMIDTATSFNNSSRKTFTINPVLGGYMAILSSILSMYLIWGF